MRGLRDSTNDNDNDNDNNNGLFTEAQTAVLLCSKTVSDFLSYRKFSSRFLTSYLIGKGEITDKVHLSRVQLAMAVIKLWVSFFY